MAKDGPSSANATWTPGLDQVEDERVQTIGDKLLGPLRMLAQTMARSSISIDCAGEQRAWLDKYLDGMLRNLDLSANTSSTTIRSTFEEYLAKHPEFRDSAENQQWLLRILDLLLARRQDQGIETTLRMAPVPRPDLAKRTEFNPNDMLAVAAAQARAATTAAMTGSANIAAALDGDATIAVFAGADDDRTKAIRAGIETTMARIAAAERGAVVAPTAGVINAPPGGARIIIAMPKEQKTALLAAPFEGVRGGKELQGMVNTLMANIGRLQEMDGPTLAQIVNDLRPIYPHIDDETRDNIFLTIEDWINVMTNLHESGHEPTFIPANTRNICRAYQTIIKLLKAGLTDAGALADKYHQEMTANEDAAETIFAISSVEKAGAAIERTEGEAIRTTLREATRLLRIHRAMSVRDAMVKKAGADFPGEMEAASSVHGDLINIIGKIEKNLGFFQSFFMPRDEKEKYRKTMQDLSAIAESIKEYEMRDIKIDERFTTILGHKLRAADEALKKVLTHDGVPKEGIGAETIEAIGEFSKAEREARNTLPQFFKKSS